MGDSLTVKLIKSHLVHGEPIPGHEVAIKIDQTLTQDATGTMAYLQFEALETPRIATELSVSYIDHNTLQLGFENGDDHLYLQSAAARFGAYFSRPGNGICHQVHLERFGLPGKTLLGSDSHTPTAGALGMLAIGAGGLDVAVAMAGEPFYFTMPKVVGVVLTGKLAPWVAAKDVILHLLSRLTVRGGTGKIFEYLGEGVKELEIPQRATMANMGAELGATTSVFPSDEVTYEFLRQQGREQGFVPLAADPDAHYDEIIHVDLSKITPLIAAPHSPDAVSPVEEVEGTPLHQIIIGSCTNSSYRDLMTVAAILKNRTIHHGVSLAIAPGSRQVLEMLARNGALGDLIAAGARILESACGPCIGMGMAPPSKGVSLRTFNRNFKGRSGTRDALVYLASPEVAAASALFGEITDPRRLGTPPAVPAPKYFLINDNLLLAPSSRPEEHIPIIRGPNIKPLPANTPYPRYVKAKVVLKLGDNITTDDIMPAGPKVLPLRSNIPAMAEYAFESIDREFPRRARALGQSIIVGGQNYGQGSSREHAAIVPMYLGVKAVLAISFARIHQANLVNFGILPLVIEPSDYADIDQGDELEIAEIGPTLASGHITITNLTKGKRFTARHNLTLRQVEILLKGGLLNFVRSKIKT